jgi:hypothetical protein
MACGIIAPVHLAILSPSFAGDQSLHRPPSAGTPGRMMNRSYARLFLMSNYYFASDANDRRAFGPYKIR